MDPGSQPTPPPGALPADEFVSEPLPFTLHLNATRPIQVDVLVTGTPNAWGDCPYRLDLTVRIDGKVIAGAPAFTRYNGWYPEDGSYRWYVPEDPPGFAICRYRILSEQATLEKGSVLRIVIAPATTTANSNFRYGFGADHRSQIRLAYYSLEEWQLRRPPIEKEPGEPAPPATLAGAAIGSLGLAATPRPRHRRTSAAVLIALLLASGGCLGGPSGGGSASSTPEITGGQANVTQVKDPDGGAASGGNGSVVGLVSNDLGQPLEATHLFLLGTTFFAKTNRYGSFSFTEVPPGSYMLRADRAGYKSLETQVNVRTGYTTRIEVILESSEAKATDFRPHRHDYWGDQTEAILLDEPVSRSKLGGFNIPMGATKGVFNNVRPGTYAMEVVLNWNVAEIPYTRLGLAFEANHDPVRYNSSVLYPRGPGQKFHIPIAWEMADSGHQPFSLWKLSAYYDSRPGTAAPEPNPTLALGTGLISPGSAHVKIVIRKGSVPLEPPHPDHWRGEDAIPVDTQQREGPQPLTVIFGSALIITNCMADIYTYYQHHALAPPRRVIPQETTWLEATLTLSRPTGVLGVGHYDWILHYKPGNVAPATYTAPSRTGAANPNPAFKTAPAPQISSDQKVYKWRVPLAEGEGDPFYARRSAFAFGLAPSDQNQACIDSHLAAATGVLRLTWTLVAHRGPMPA